jgi:hypothetical protein
LALGRMCLGETVLNAWTGSSWIGTFRFCDEECLVQLSAIED